MTAEQAAKRHAYRAEYNHGLLNPTVVYAFNEEEAKKQALAEYRRCSGYADSVDKFPLDFVVKSVVMVEE